MDLIPPVSSSNVEWEQLAYSARIELYPVAKSVGKAPLNLAVSHHYIIYKSSKLSSNCELH